MTELNKELKGALQKASTMSERPSTAPMLSV